MTQLTAMQMMIEWLQQKQKRTMVSHEDEITKAIELRDIVEKEQIIEAVDYGIEVEAGLIDRDRRISAGEQFYQTKYA